MDWLTPIDLYCERAGPGLWAEPLNAFTNAAFPLAALWGWQALRRYGGAPGFGLAVVMAALIGVGSFLFHVYANAWSEWADVVPIWGFVALYVGLSTYHLGGAPARAAWIAGSITAVAATATLTLTSATGAETGPPGLLNGSGQYAPALIALLALAGLMAWRGHPARGWILAAALAFTVSLVARTLDLHLCADVPAGTHFIWHLMNGLMVGLLLQALIRHRRA